MQYAVCTHVSVDMSTCLSVAVSATHGNVANWNDSVAMQTTSKIITNHVDSFVSK